MTSCFRPHVWGSFFMTVKVGIIVDTKFPFSSPCLGIFFYATCGKTYSFEYYREFSSPCLGIFFYEVCKKVMEDKLNSVFVPMFGDLFLMEKLRHETQEHFCFRPHVWGSFFNILWLLKNRDSWGSFRPHVWGSFFNQCGNVTLKFDGIPFSSPCLGIFFYAWSCCWRLL